MATHKKLGTLRGVTEWKTLDSPSDVRRFLRWCILSVRDQTLDIRTAGTLGLLGCYMLRALEMSDLEKRLADIERRLAEPESPDGPEEATRELHSPTTTH
jgi:hypothetical protein